MAGHVFIVRGDLTKLYCDGWLMPTDRHLHVLPHWIEEIPNLKLNWLPVLDDSWDKGELRVQEIKHWPFPEQRVWLVNTGAWQKEAQWYVDGVVEFFKTVGPIFQQKGSGVAGRARPLLGLPLVGTGAGGAGDWTGTLLAALLPSLYDAAKEYDVDVALVLKPGPSFAAAMNARKNYLKDRAGIWKDELGENLEKVARDLAEHAKKGELVLFLGAGVSASAGLPNWKDLLELLAKSAGVLSSANKEGQKVSEAFHSLNVLDQARLIADYCGKKESTIGKEVAGLLKRYHHYSISHAMLAGIQMKEVVTTNYDVLFERASKYAQDIAPSVIPYESPKSGGSWILKLHGCVNHPSDIVLTRSDYLRYNDSRAALKGIVHALLITRHMLFVGFSLSDDNFYGIIEDVRKAVRENKNRGTGDEPFGTVLATESNHFAQQLWHDDLNWVSLQRGEGATIADSRRLQEIFLDYLAFLTASSTAHLLNEKYKGALSESELVLRSALQEMIRKVDAKAKEAPAWLEIQNLVERFGGTC